MINQNENREQGVKKHVPYQEYIQKGYILKGYINDEVIELQKQGYILL